MRKWYEPFTTAWIGVITHKLRSSLTILGIVIGVAAVIALMSVGKGAEASILSNIEGLGSNLIFISPGTSVQAGGIKGGAGSANTLTLEDAEAISQEKMPEIATYVADLLKAQQAGIQRSRSWFESLRSFFEQKFGRDWLDRYKEAREKYDWLDFDD